MPLSRKQQYLILFLAALVSMGFRVWLSLDEEWWDIWSWHVVANIVLDGKNVYAETYRYNYGPVWAYILAGLNAIKLSLGYYGTSVLHVFISVFLGLVDCLIAVTLLLRFGLIYSLLYILSPTVIGTASIHGQFNNMALLLGFWGWLILERAENRQKTLPLLASNLLFGLSLMVKHILFFFPLWLLFWKELGSIKKRIVYAGGIYLLFFIGFMPFLFSEAARTGIKINVFQYSSGYRHGLLSHLMTLFLPMDTWEWLFSWLPFLTAEKFLWAVLMILSGVLVFRRYPDKAFYFYPVALIAFTPHMLLTYFVIPILSCVVFHRRYWEAWAYMIAATLGYDVFCGVYWYSFTCGNGLSWYQPIPIWMFILMMREFYWPPSRFKQLLLNQTAQT